MYSMVRADPDSTSGRTSRSRSPRRTRSGPSTARSRSITLNRDPTNSGSARARAQLVLMRFNPNEAMYIDWYFDPNWCYRRRRRHGVLQVQASSSPGAGRRRRGPDERSCSRTRRSAGARVSFRYNYDASPGMVSPTAKPLARQLRRRPLQLPALGVRPGRHRRQRLGLRRRSRSSGHRPAHRRDASPSSISFNDELGGHIKDYYIQRIDAYLQSTIGASRSAPTWYPTRRPGRRGLDPRTRRRPARTVAIVPLPIVPQHHAGRHGPDSAQRQLVAVPEDAAVHAAARRPVRQARPAGLHLPAGRRLLPRVLHAHAVLHLRRPRHERVRDPRGRRGRATAPAM